MYVLQIIKNYCQSSSPHWLPVRKRGVYFKDCCPCLEVLHYDDATEDFTTVLRRSGQCPRSSTATICIDWLHLHSYHGCRHETSVGQRGPSLSLGRRSATATSLDWYKSSDLLTYSLAVQVIIRHTKKAGETILAHFLTIRGQMSPRAYGVSAYV